MTLIKGALQRLGNRLRLCLSLEIGSEVMVQGRKVNGTSNSRSALSSQPLSLRRTLHPNIDMTTPPTKLRKGWIYIDDELVSNLRTEDVFESGV
jgi:ubiquitin carboxyl-terminal hydrolase 10